MRPLLLSLMLVASLLATLFAYGFHEARRMPVVVRARLALPDWPAGAPPARVVLLSDIHLGNAAMDAPRMARIVTQVNALRPDLILLAGDYVADYDVEGGRRSAALLGPLLRRLRARWGTLAVLGNHDIWASDRDIFAWLRRAGATPLQNQAVTRGPLAIAALGDEYTHRLNVGAALTQQTALSGARVTFVHSPAGVHMPPGSLLLAGHTHCGQVGLALVGSVLPVRPLWALCGFVRRDHALMIVTGGLGTSHLPVRFGAPPDMWLLTLGPAHPRPARSSLAPGNVPQQKHQH